MTVTKKKEGTTLYVAIEGSLDIKTSPQLQAELEGELDDVTEVCFDLKESDYTSSAGLRVFLGTYRVMDEKNGRVVLKNVNESFMSVLKMSGFADFLEVE